jgi:hypothetical protein
LIRGGASYFFAIGEQLNSTTISARRTAIIAKAAELERRFLAPWAMAIDGAELFVLDTYGPHGAGGIFELTVTTGALVRVVQGPAYQLYAPSPSPRTARTSS